MKYARRQDKNHALLRDYLRRQGVEVLEIFEPLDLLVKYRDFVGFVEVKDDSEKKQAYTAKQLKFIAETRFPVIFATNDAQAFQAVKDRQTVTERQKQAISGLLLRKPQKTYWAKDIREILSND